MGDTAYGYIRGPAASGDKCDPLADQERVVRDFAAAHGLAVARIFTDTGPLGATKWRERPVGKALADILQAGDCIIAPSIDRISRIAPDILVAIAVCQDSGIGLYLADTGHDIAREDNAALVTAILTATASERRRHGIALLKSDRKVRGSRPGIPPFGWRRTGDGQFAEDPHQQDLIIRMVAARARGLSLREIVEKMQQEGTRISESGVAKVLAAYARRASLKPTTGPISADQGSRTNQPATGP
jgi:DNA invertase Pin-like site-specific DNA recombinase